MQKYRLKLVGIHMHIGSGVDYGHLEQVCGAMVRRAGMWSGCGGDFGRRRTLDTLS